MRLNNKGFAISSIMYIILVLAIVLITLTLGIFSNRKMILDKKKKETLNEIYGTRYKDVIKDLKESAILYATNNSVDKESIQIKNLENSVDKEILEEYELLDKYLTMANNNGNYDVYLGESITIDGNNKEVENLIDIMDYTIEGNSVQDGEPTITNPVEVKSVGDTNLFNKNKEPDNLISYFGHELKEKQNYTLKIELKDGKTVPAGIFFGLVYYKEEGGSAGAKWLLNNGTLNTKFGDGVSYAIADINASDYYLTMVGCTTSTENWYKILDAFEITLVEGVYDFDTIPDNVEYGKYNIPINVKSRNLLDKNQSIQNGIKNETSVYGWGSGAFNSEWLSKNLKPNTQYTISYDIECVSVPEYDTQFAANLGFFLYSTNSGATNISFLLKEYLDVGEKRHVEKTFTAPSDIQDKSMKYGLNFYTNRYLKDNVGVYSDMIISNIQIEEGSKATEYVPYVNESVVISLDEPLRCVNNNCDLLNYDKKELIQKNKEAIVNSFNIYNNEYYKGFYSLDVLDGVYNRITGLSNLTKNIGELYNSQYKDTLWIGVGGNAIYWVYNSFYDENLEDKGLSNLTEFVSKQPLKIYYNTSNIENKTVSLPKIKTGLGYKSTISVDTTINPSSVKFIGIKKISKL